MHVFLKWVMQGRIVMNDQTVGFVLKEVPYQEKAVIVSLLTKEGKISFIAKGIRNINSKNAAALQLFTKVEVEYDHREGKELQVLKERSLYAFIVMCIVIYRFHLWPVYWLILWIDWLF